MDGRNGENYYRSWIYHNTLGNYNYIFIEDMAGIQPRSDEKLEFYPIDFSYDHFMVNNLRYHGKDLTVVWDKPGDGVRYYEGLPEGYSVYVDGEQAFTLKDLRHVVYDPASGALDFPDGEAEILAKNSVNPVPTATEVSLTDEKEVGILKKSGINGLENLAKAALVEASFTPSSARAASWESSHRGDGNDPTSRAVNETAPDPQAVTDGMTVNMPFWGNDGSSSDTDFLIVNLDGEKQVDMLDIYFYNDRQNGGYSEPQKYAVEYWDGSDWKHV